MAQIGRPKAALMVTDVERTELVRLTKRAHVNRLLAFRARLVLACADAPTDTVVARRNRTTNTTVGKWRKRFIDRRLGRRGGGRQDARNDPEGRNPLEHANDGREGRHESYDDRPHLADVWAQTAHYAVVQDVARPP